MNIGLHDLFRSNLDFHNTTLFSGQISELSSRSLADPSVEFCGRKLDVPIIAAPMPDVCDGKTARLIYDLGGFAFLHRFGTIEEQVEEFIKSDKTAGCAIGIVGDWHDRFTELYNAGCSIFCIDVANGANTTVLDTAFYLKEKYADIRLITGNVCSDTAYKALFRISDGIRVGVAGGAGCSTRNATGIYRPILSLVHECKTTNDFYGENVINKVICDGGIKEPQDLCKALTFGANCVMIGSQIAACKDSPAEYDESDWNGYGQDCEVKIFRGSASFENQKNYKETPRYIEGKTVYLNCKETIEQMFQRYRDGLVSSMSYANAKNIKEYRQNMSFIKL